MNNELIKQLKLQIILAEIDGHAGGYSLSQLKTRLKMAENK